MPSTENPSMNANISGIPERWAVIVGISKYDYTPLNLSYAETDARKLCDFLKTAPGGNYDEEKICLLLNEQATLAKLTRAMRTFLKRPERTDFVLLYFACHGAPDPERPNNVYFLPHDTDPKDIASTALSMRVINEILQDGTLEAEKVVILVDACYSGAVATYQGNVRSPEVDAQTLKAQLQDLGKAKSGVALLTSAQTRELAQEDKQWGEGHGVFTYYLLKGIQGEADGYLDKKPDGRVSVGELFRYVQDNVTKATKEQQHPNIGSYGYDASLPMAWTGGIDAQKRYELGWHLCEMGRLLDDSGRYTSAIRQFEEALSRLPKRGIDLPAAVVQLGRSYLATGQYDKAVYTLRRLAERDVDKASGEALLLLGIACARAGDDIAAEKWLSRFVEQHKEDENCAWVTEYIKSPAAGRRYALIIGINEYQFETLLQGPLNDVKLINEVLTQKLGFDTAHITQLTDATASRVAILDALDTLSRTTTEADIVFVHFSGLGNSRVESEYDAYLLPQDATHQQNRIQGAISALELHEKLCAIPASRKLLILDTDANEPFIKLVGSGEEYTVLSATVPGKQSFEFVHKSDEKMLVGGVFSTAIVQVLANADMKVLTYGQLFDSVVAKVHITHPQQGPLLIGNRNRALVGAEIWYLNLWDFVQRKSYLPYTTEQLLENYEDFQKRFGAPYAAVHLSFGRAFLEKRAYDLAYEALERAKQLCDRQDHEIWSEILFTLSKAQTNRRNYAVALQLLDEYKQLPVMAARQTKAQDLIDAIKQQQYNRSRHALLVGIDDYPNSSSLLSTRGVSLRPTSTEARSQTLSSLLGAVDDVLSMKDVLQKQCGFAADNITTLFNSNATRSVILESFKQLVDKARDEPALFYFAGGGSVDEQGAPTLVSVDGRQDGTPDIPLAELARLVPQTTSNLVVILDAGWTLSESSPVAGRMLPPNLRSPSGTRHLGVMPPRQAVIQDDQRDPAQINPIGALSLYNHSMQWRARQQPIVVIKKGDESKPNEPGRVYGTLTLQLVHALRNLSTNDLEKMTYRKWFDKVVQDLGEFRPVLLGSNLLDAPIFTSYTVAQEVEKGVKQLEYSTIDQTIDILLGAIGQQGDQDPEGYLNLGLAYTAKEDTNNAIRTLRKAHSLLESMHLPTDQPPQLSMHTRELQRQIWYHLGRMLLYSQAQEDLKQKDLKREDLTLAVSLLGQVYEVDKANARVCFYLGKALQTLAERINLSETTELWDFYLNKGGAPLGHRDEVRHFLTERRQQLLAR